MDETKELIKLAEQQIIEIDEELGIHGEKYLAIQKKIGMNKSHLFENDRAILNLTKAIKMNKIFLFIAAILFTFTFLLIIIKYFRH